MKRKRSSKACPIAVSRATACEGGMDGTTTTDSSSKSDRIDLHTAGIRSCSTSNRACRAASSSSDNVT